MIAKFTKTDVSNAKNMGQEKEMVDCYNLIGFKKGEFKNLVTARFYMGRAPSASVVYCSIWIYGKEIYISGSGNASGYGYHKGSAAMQSALDSAGVELYGSPYVEGREKERRGEKVDYKKRAHIDGVGDTAMRDAFFAIGEALRYTRKQLHLIHN